MGKNIHIKDAGNEQYLPKVNVSSVDGLGVHIVRAHNVNKLESTETTETTGNTELEDMRVDGRGNVYSSARDMINGNNEIYTVLGVDFSKDKSWENAYISTAGISVESGKHIRSDYIMLKDLTLDSYVSICCPVEYRYRAVFYKVTKEYIIPDENPSDWYQDQNDIDIPAEAAFVILVMKRVDGEIMDLTARKDLYVRNARCSILPYARNFYDDFKWIDKRYYNKGSLKVMKEVKCCNPLKLWPGAIIQFSTMYKTIEHIIKKEDGDESTQIIKGTRICFYKDNKWIRDIEPGNVYNKPYIVIPEDCDGISFTMAIDDIAPRINIFEDLYTWDDSKVLMRLKNSDNPIAGKMFSVLGDQMSLADESLTEDKLWWKLIADRHKMSCLANNSVADTLVACKIDPPDDTHIASETRIEALSVEDEDTTTTDRIQPDIIFIYAGKNDIARKDENGVHTVEIGTFVPDDGKEISNIKEPDSVDSFASAYKTMLYRIQNIYSNARVICILPGYSKDDYNSERLKTFNEMIIDECIYYGIEYVDCRKIGVNMFKASGYSGSDIYKTEEVMKSLADAVSCKLDRLFNEENNLDYSVVEKFC